MKIIRLIGRNENVYPFQIEVISSFRSLFFMRKLRKKFFGKFIWKLVVVIIHIYVIQWRLLLVH